MNQIKYEVHLRPDSEADTNFVVLCEFNFAHGKSWGLIVTPVAVDPPKLKSVLCIDKRTVYITMPAVIKMKEPTENFN